MKLTQKYNQIIKDSRIKEYNRLCEVYGKHNIEIEFNSLQSYIELRNTVKYSEILDYLNEQIHGYCDPYMDA